MSLIIITILYKINGITKYKLFANVDVTPTIQDDVDNLVVLYQKKITERRKNLFNKKYLIVGYKYNEKDTNYIIREWKTKLLSEMKEYNEFIKAKIDMNIPDVKAFRFNSKMRSKIKNTSWIKITNYPYNELISDSEEASIEDPSPLMMQTITKKDETKNIINIFNPTLKTVDAKGLTMIEAISHKVKQYIEIKNDKVIKVVKEKNINESSPSIPQKITIPIDKPIHEDKKDKKSSIVSQPEEVVKESVKIITPSINDIKQSSSYELNEIEFDIKSIDISKIIVKCYDNWCVHYFSNAYVTHNKQKYYIMKTKNPNLKNKFRTFYDGAIKINRYFI